MRCWLEENGCVGELLSMGIGRSIFKRRAKLGRLWKGWRNGVRDSHESETSACFPTLWLYIPALISQPRFMHMVLDTWLQSPLFLVLTSHDGGEKISLATPGGKTQRNESIGPALIICSILWLESGVSLHTWRRDAELQKTVMRPKSLLVGRRKRFFLNLPIFRSSKPIADLSRAESPFHKDEMVETHPPQLWGVPLYLIGPATLPKDLPKGVSTSIPVISSHPALPLRCKEQDGPNRNHFPTLYWHFLEFCPEDRSQISPARDIRLFMRCM